MRAPIVLLLAVASLLAVLQTVSAWYRNPGIPAALQPEVAQPTTTSPTSTLLAPSNAQESPDTVLVWLESDPTGATMVRVKDGFILGVTPETIAIPRSDRPVAIRFELEGYIAETREVKANADGELSVKLKAIRKDKR